MNGAASIDRRFPNWIIGTFLNKPHTGFIHFSTWLKHRKYFGLSCDLYGASFQYRRTTRVTIPTSNFRIQMPERNLTIAVAAIQKATAISIKSIFFIFY